MSQTLPSKEMAELQRRFKTGYSVEQLGSGHFAVIDKDGNKVKSANGKPLSIPGTPHGGRATKNVEAELSRAGVLRATPQQAHKPAPSSAELERRRKIAASNQIRAKGRQEIANGLFDRLDPLVQKIGGWQTRGTRHDLAHIGAMIARERGVESVQSHHTMTPDLLLTSISRVAEKNWVVPAYQAIWEELASRLEKAEDVSTEFFSLLRRAKGLPETVVAFPSQLEMQVGDWPFRVELVDLKQMVLDHAYQRPANWPFIRAKAAIFDATLVGTLDVAERHHGATYAILDGQQRFEMMRLVGKEKCYCAIYTGLDLQAEAAFFLHKNQDRKAVHPYYTYQAKIVARDPNAIAIEKIAKSFGYKIAITSASTRSAEDHISAIASLEEAYGRSNDERAECLTPTLATLKAATFGMKEGQSAHLIRALGRIFERYYDSDIDRERLIETISVRGAAWLIGKMREVKWGRSTQSPALATVIVEEYNRGLPRQEKLVFP